MIIHKELLSHLESVANFVGAHLWGAINSGSHSDAVDRGAQPRSYRLRDTNPWIGKATRIWKTYAGCFHSLLGAHLWGTIIGDSHSDSSDRGAQPRSYKVGVLSFCRSAPMGRDYLNRQKVFRKYGIKMALTMSMKKAQTNGTIINARCDAPYCLLTADILARAVGVEPREIPPKPAHTTAAS